MKVCESCGGMKCRDRISHGTPIKVICGCCLGTGLISLGPESEARWREHRAAALSQAIREGWYEEIWAGEPGNARKVIRLIGRADLVQARTA